jgi:hypothetical protein
MRSSWTLTSWFSAPIGAGKLEGRDEKLGSVSAAVAQETPCPLLLVPPAVWQRLDAPT